MATADRVTRDFGALTAVADVTMHVGPGEVVGLLGANGAGKTTLLRMLLGLLLPTTGEVRILGGAPDRKRRSRLGYVPQGLGLYGDLTVMENLAFVAAAFHAPVPDLSSDLSEQSDRLVAELPLGLQRRLAFSCALLHHPELLILDEPTSGVDPVARADLWDTIREEADRGVGVLVTTHYMQEAQQCDRLLLMSDGLLVAQGSESDIIGSTTATEVVVDDWAVAFAALEASGALVTLSGRSVRVADADVARITQLLDAAGIAAELRSVPATIEERMVVLAKSAGSSVI